MLLYVLVAALLLRDAGNVILGTAIVPIIASATLYGRRGGVLGAGAVIVIGTSLAAAYETLDEPRSVFIRYAIALGLGWLVGQSANEPIQVREELARRREAEEELHASTTRLEGLLESQNEFVATVSHELRTPSPEWSASPRRCAMARCAQPGGDQGARGAHCRPGLGRGGHRRGSPGRGAARVGAARRASGDPGHRPRGDCGPDVGTAG